MNVLNETKHFTLNISWLQHCRFCKIALMKLSDKDRSTSQAGKLLTITMKICVLITCVMMAPFAAILAQTNKSSNNLPNFNHSVKLESKADTSANISCADLNNDGHLDLLLVKGRHWPIIDRVFIGDGKGGFRKNYPLGKIADRSYSGCLADFNGDGFMDIAISNDDPDRKLIYLNDGKGNFSIGSEFGLPGWETRNVSIADINRDGLPDIIVANRSESVFANYICLNRGKGYFDANGIPFARYPATTITPADINQDGFIDLVVPHRDKGQSWVYLGSADTSFPDTRRIPFGPADAQIRVAAVADLNGDHFPDIVTTDETKGVYCYFGQRDHSFSPGLALADATVVPYALTLADLNKDGKMDIIVGHVAAPSTIYFNDGSGMHYTPVSFGDAQGDVYGFAIADLDEDGQPDIAAARSGGPSMVYFGSTRTSKK